MWSEELVQEMLGKARGDFRQVEQEF